MAVLSCGLMAGGAKAECGPTCKERVARERCSQATPKWCVERAILTHRVGEAGARWMRRIPACESGWSPFAKNPSGAAGLFQFMPSTWRSTPYGKHSVYTAKWNALAAGYMWRAGRAPYEWECR